MSETVGVIAMGEMGSAVARRLHERGATVITQLTGRTPASAARAERAGAIPVSTDDEFAAQSDFILSIVPPGERVAGHMSANSSTSSRNANSISSRCRASDVGMRRPYETGETLNPAKTPKTPEEFDRYRIDVR